MNIDLLTAYSLVAGVTGLWFTFGAVWASLVSIDHRATGHDRGADILAYAALACFAVFGIGLSILIHVRS